MCEFTGKTQHKYTATDEERCFISLYTVYSSFHYLIISKCVLFEVYWIHWKKDQPMQCLVTYTAAKMDKRISEKTEWILYAEGFLHCGPLIQHKARLAGCQIYCLIQQCPHVSATFWAHRTWGNTGARKIAYNCASVHRNVTHFLAYSYFRSQLVSAANFASEVLHKIGKP